MNYEERIRKFDIISKEFEGGDEDLEKENRLGKGEHGVVHKGVLYTKDNQPYTLVIKKMYINEEDAVHIDKKKWYSKEALKIQSFIEVAACTMVTELVRQKMCPNFVMTYYYDFIERDGVCSDKYPYKGLLYNEWIPNLELFSIFSDDKSRRKGREGVKEWFNAYFQILVAIHSMQKVFGMTHSDLHGNNILVAKIPKGGHWKYTIEGIDYYVPNLGYQFLLNDFDHAWIPGKMESWYTRKYKNQFNKKKLKLVDPVRIFDEVLDISVAPKEVKDIIFMTMDLFKNVEMEVVDLIYTIFGSYFFLTEIEENESEISKACKKDPYFCYFQKLDTPLIDSYDLDKQFDKNSLPKELQKLVCK